MKGGMITRINDELKAIEENFSIEELFLKHGIISLMFYEPLEFQQLIIKINMERDKHSDTQSRLMFIPLYKKVYLAQRKKLLELFDAVKNRTIKIIPEPTREEMQTYTNESWEYLPDISNSENVYLYAFLKRKKNYIFLESILQFIIMIEATMLGDCSAIDMMMK